MAMTPAEQAVQYQIMIDAAQALQELQQLKAAGASVDELITAVSQKAQMLGKSWGMSGAAAVQELKQLDQTAAKSVGSVTDLTSKSVIFGDMATKSWGDVSTSVKNAEGAVTSFGHGIDFVRVALGTMAAVLVFNVGQAIVNTFTQAAEAAKVFEVAIYNIQNAERVMSEAGIKVTMKDLLDIVNNLQTAFKGLFSKTELTDAVADIAIATKDLGLSVNQVQQLAQAIGTLQLRNPELTYQEVEQKVLTSLLSGQTRGIRSLGVAFDDATVKQEAYTLGIAKMGQELTIQQKSLATVALLYQSTSQEMDNVTIRQNTLSGATQTLSATWQDFLRNMGTLAAPVIMQLAEALTKMLQNANQDFETFKAQVETVATMLAAFAAAGLKIADAYGKGGILGALMSGQSAWKAFNDAIKQSTDYFNQLNSVTQDTPTNLDAIAGAMADLSKVNLDSLISSITNFAEQLNNLNYQYTTQSQNAQQDYLTKLSRAQQDYQISVANAQQDYNNRRRQTEQNYRNRELDAEAKFQEELRQLREKYLFDLEDALRDRDARQVLRLMAQYQMNKTNLENNFKNDQAQRQRQYQQELQDARVQEQLKLQQMAQAEALKEQRMTEDYNTERARRLAQYQHDLADLKKNWDDKLQQEADSLAKDLGLNEQQRQALYNLLNEYYGPGGAFDKLYDYSYNSIVARSKMILQALQAMISQVSSATMNVAAMVPGVINNNAVNPANRAKGGIDIVSTPTTTAGGRLVYGEAGAEAHIFIPLSGQAGGSISQGSVSGLASMFGGGAIDIALDLSPDLEARVIRNTLDRAGSVVTRIRRGRS